MKTRGFVLIMVAVAFAFAPAKLNAQGNYAAKLISPVAGQVLYAGQKIMIEWQHRLPNIPLAGCESEAWLSLDGGRSFTLWITFLDPTEYIFPLDCSEHAYQCSGTGHSLRVRLALPRKLRSSACIDVHHREEWSADGLNSDRKISV